MGKHRVPKCRRVRRSAGALIAAWLSGCLILAGWGCQAETKDDRSRDASASLVARAQEFQALLEQEEYETARTMMAPEARRWWESREGDGEPWAVGATVQGPWAGWDEHFRSEKEIMEWKEGPRSATAVIRETNDYYRLLERGWATNEVTYFFDEAGTIEGLLIRGVGERPMGKTDAFVDWANAHDPEELAMLMPGGEIDPSGDHPQRFRRLLNRWREATGLEPIH